MTGAKDEKSLKATVLTLAMSPTESKLIEMRFWHESSGFWKARFVMPASEIVRRDGQCVADDRRINRGNSVNDSVGAGTGLHTDVLNPRKAGSFQIIARAAHRADELVKAAGDGLAAEVHAQERTD